MKKITLLLITTLTSFFLSFVNLHGQHQDNPRWAREGRTHLSVGAGLLPTFAKDRGASIIPPLSVGLDYRLSAHFNVGFQIGHSATEVSRRYAGMEENARWRNNFTTIGLRVSAQYSVSGKWDVYGGSIVGHGFAKIEILSGDPDELQQRWGVRRNNNALIFSGFVGARYHIGKNIGLFSELGLDSSLLKAGLSFRI